MRFLILYNATQTYTQTVLEHLQAFRNHSRYEWFYLHWERLLEWRERIGEFDAVVVHYSVRLPFDQITEEMAQVIAGFHGVRAAFVQDEYDGTRRARYWLQRMAVDVVFTVVPEASISTVYPPEEFPDTHFHNVLTGYVPETLIQHFAQAAPTQRRRLTIGYRGRSLPIHYGALGREKLLIAEQVKSYCAVHGVSHDIEWSDDSRIYGADWYRFVASCKAMLGTESGSNVFDWNSTLKQDIAAFRRRNRRMNEGQLYEAMIKPLELPGVMNQVSPRVFEMAAARTVMVLFEGAYSGVVQPGKHFLALRKDFSNLAEIFEQLEDDELVAGMTERAYADVVGSGRYSYRTFVEAVDAVLAETHKARVKLPVRRCAPSQSFEELLHPLVAPAPGTWRTEFFRRAYEFGGHVWTRMPVPVQNILRPIARAVLRLMFKPTG